MKELLRSGPLLQLGWVVALTTLAPLGLGVALDRHLGTAPLFILIGAIIGIIAGTVSAVRITNRAIEALAPRPGADKPAENRKEDQTGAEEAANRP